MLQSFGKLLHAGPTGRGVCCWFRRCSSNSRVRALWVQIDAKRGGLYGTIVGTFSEHLGTTVGISDCPVFEPLWKLKSSSVLDWGRQVK
jgi:hypothetical protein